MRSSTLTRILAEFATQYSFETMSTDDVVLMEGFFLDWLGCVFGGYNENSTRKALAASTIFGMSEEADVLPSKSKGSQAVAALVNGVASHALEMDDLHREAIIHTASPTIPAVLAAAQSRHASGRDTLAALAVAFEVHIRVSLAMGPSHYTYWHTTGTCGTLGAAAGVAKIIGLEPERFTWALGTAGTSAAGLWEFLADSAMSKQLHPGKAAMEGLMAAYLAQHGFTGTKAILEGPKGLFKAMSKDPDPSRITEGLGEVFHWRRNSLKHHASCGHTHSTLDAALQATDNTPLSPAKVLGIEAQVYGDALDLLGQVKPTDPYLAKFSLEFCLARALAHAQVGPDAFTEEALQDPATLAFMPLIRIERDDELTSQYPLKWPARVKIRLRDGGVLTGAIDYPKGDPEVPLDQQEIITKFKMLTREALSPAEANSLIECGFALDHVQDMSHFFDGVSSLEGF